MMHNEQQGATRRAFFKDAGRFAAASALAGIAIPHVYAAEDNTIRVALVGGGGRGTGAAANALAAKNGPMKLVAVADVFQDRVTSSINGLAKEFGDRMDVPEDRRFVSFDGYRKAMDCLKPGDVVILTTPPAFRNVQFSYAIEKGLNVFMEKPTTVDGPTTRKMLALADESVKKNLKVGVGLMFRHCRARMDIHDRIAEGQIGDILTMRSYRMHGPIASFASDPKPAGISELLYQIQRFHSFLWCSGGCFNDFYVHNIDECCWMKNAWPVQAQASGGRHFRGNSVDQNFDNYSVEYTFADGTKLFYFGRCILGCYEQGGSYVHGTKGLAVPGSNIYKGQKLDNAEIAWKPSRNSNPYEDEWTDLIDAIRQDKPYNETKRGAEASLASSLGRMAAHSGQVVTWDEMLNHEHEFAPDVDKMTMDSPAPLLAGPDGKYPVPQPGMTIKREY